jgi:hypothetical protein
MIDLFMDGGVVFMSILTFLLAGVLVSAKMYKDKVRALGFLAVTVGFLGAFLGLYSAFIVIEQVGDASPSIIAGGIKVAFTTILYGLIILIISLVLDIINKSCKCCK